MLRFERAKRCSNMIVVVFFRDVERPGRRCARECDLVRFDMTCRSWAHLPARYVLLEPREDVGLRLESDDAALRADTEGHDARHVSHVRANVDGSVTWLEQTK